MILLQTAEVYVVNERNNKEIKGVIWFRIWEKFFSQCAYTCLQLPKIFTKNLKINTIGNENSQSL